MTAVLDVAVEAPGADLGSEQRPASWSARVGAFAVDVLLGVAVVVTLGLLAWTAPLFGWLWFIYTVTAVLIVMAVAVNRWLLPSVIGWSVGRALCGIAVTRRRDDARCGLGRLLLRDLAHLLDTAALFVGWLWPLWDRRRGTFADMLLRTEVRRVERPDRDLRRPVALLLAGAVLLCALAVGLGYLGMYRPDRAVDEARAQIAERGPQLVEQMLSYRVDTLQEDFARAQTLATDGYRPQLVAQQQAVQQAEATNNEYWTVGSAVLSASQNNASMLLAMQGQRGIEPQELKVITATVRVEFEKPDDQWRVAGLTVLKRPHLAGGAE